eukprot:1152803-Pelagomonas_calceolata.AAC.1
MIQANKKQYAMFTHVHQHKSRRRVQAGASMPAAAAAAAAAYAGHDMRTAHAGHEDSLTGGCEGVVGQHCTGGFADLDAAVRACGLHAAGSVPEDGDEKKSNEKSRGLADLDAAMGARGLDAAGRNSGMQVCMSAV